MFNFEIDPGLTLFLLFFHCLMGGIAALIAKQKGRRFNRWLIIGLIGGTPVFFTALWIKPLPTRV
ncbi:MAG: hypothetical protein VKK42_17105 [Lyngbya sp.]|nr:hypothetical protein [Lyngbya sp.]